MASQKLTHGLLGFVSGVGYEQTAGNVMPADELPPISALLAAYDGIIASRQRDGVRE
jgi:hypothetical protein